MAELLSGHPQDGGRGTVDPAGRTGRVLPEPPTDEEKYSYVTRRVWVLNLTSMISFTCMAVSQYRLVRHDLWALLLVPFLAFTLLYYLISLRVNLSRGNFDLAAHRRLVEGWSPPSHPDVDIFLPICGESLDVLANTWSRVWKLVEDYPGRAVPFVLDDAGSTAARRLARRFGFRYASRPDRGRFKKAGNLQYGFRNSGGAYILILDADFVPRSDLLAELLPYLEEDPRLAIIQSPQYFRVRDEQNWLERGAGAVQELFYRSVQVSRQNADAAICVGTCAVYRRAALEENGGTTLIEHSEDVHTGFDLRALGWDVRYVPLALSAGMCPDGVEAFHFQQYRWCMGSMSLLKSRKFWTAPMRTVSRLSYFSGFCYYIHTALFTLAAPVLPITLLLVRPDLFKVEYAVWLLPSVLYISVIFPYWHRVPYRLEAWSVRALYGWSHFFAILDLLRGRPEGWRATGSAAGSRRVGRLRWSVLGWSATTSAAWFALATWRSLAFSPADYGLVVGTGLFSLLVFGRILIQPRACP